MARPTASIIIRTRNEERWITPCLKAVFEQEAGDFEVVLVDNQSTDETVRKAQQFPINVVNIDDYLPGKALNAGIRVSSGRFLIFISAHCIPGSKSWLKSLISGFENERIAGVYGRQQPMTFSSPEDKRDLLITFGLDRRTQERDPFFHNANSAIRRDIWEICPFDELATNIEDRMWAEQVLERGYCILYEPEASVFHHHGIHQRGNEDRARTTVQVLDRLHGDNGYYKLGLLDPKKLKVVAIVPVRGRGPIADGEPVLRHTLDAASASGYIDETFVLTDDEATARFSEANGATIPFLRDPEYSKDHVGLNTIYEYSIREMENQVLFADLLVSLEQTYPFRTTCLIDELITHLLLVGYDSVLPTRAEYNSCWIEEEDNRRRIDLGDIPRHLKTPVLIGLRGLGFVTHPEFLRQGRLFGDKVGLVKIEDPYAHLEVRSERDVNFYKASNLKKVLDQDRKSYR